LFFTDKAQDLAQLQTAKGGLFIFVTAFFVFVLVRQALEAQSQGLSALKKNEKHLRTLIEKIPVAIVWLSLDEKNFFRNEHFVRLFGYTEEMVPTVEDWWLRAYPDPAYRHQVMQAWEQSLAAADAGNKDIEATEYLITCHSGEQRVIEFSGVVLDDGILVTFIDLTEKKRIQEEVARGRAELEAIFNSISDGILFVDTQRRILRINPAFTDLFGYRLEEIVGQTPQMIYADADQYFRQGQICFNPEARIDSPVFQNEYRRKDGTTFSGETVGVQVLDESGKLLGFMGVIHDMSERIQAEKERNRLARLVDVAPAAIIVHDVEGNILYANQTTFDLHGYTREEFMALSLHELDDPVNAGMIDERMRQLKEQGSASFEVEHMRKDGSRIPMHVSVRAAKWGDEFVFESISIDMTDQKKAQEALKESEFFFKESQRLASIGSYKADLTGNRWESSEVLDSIFGIGSEYNRTVQGWLDLIHPDDRQMMERYLTEDVVGKGNPFAKEYRIIRNNDGETRWVSGLGAVKTENQGKSILLMGTIQDITEQKKKDDEKAKLEHQLQQAQKIESIGQLAGGVAHDFNNMLGVILGRTELALRKVDPASPFVKDLEEIRTAAQRSADLTRQLLTFARKQTIAPKVLDLNETVEGMLKMLQRLIGENIQLSWTPASDLWPVKVDPSQLDQILANLCVNARDAIAGTGKITIYSQNFTFSESDKKDHPDALAKDYVRLSISDDGHGIDRETMAQIFEPFFTTKEFGQGTGLGLSTVFGAVKQNDGFIEVSSEPGQGATFHIHFPRSQETVVEVTEAREKQHRKGTETILLVEDDQMLLDLAAAMLETSGFNVLPAVTPDLAISLAKNHEGPIHLLLSDMVMPKMNGKELHKILRAIRPEMKVLFMSGYAADIIAKQGVIPEGIPFLQKPLSFEALTAKVLEVLDSAS
jgi:PAS domain S-box-containing protein